MTTAMTYVRRYRMEFDFTIASLPHAVLPDGYRWLSWEQELVERHAQAMRDSFHDELDGRVFPCLGEYAGCLNLMQEIVRQKTFLPETTWLITRDWEGHDLGEPVLPADCGTIQGLGPTGSVGSVQNVGVVAEHRGMGLGRALVLKALHGFRQARRRRVSLEVTASNSPAIELYKSVGFRLARTMYKSIAMEAAIV